MLEDVFAAVGVDVFDAFFFGVGARVTFDNRLKGVIKVVAGIADFERILRENGAAENEDEYDGGQD